MKVPLQLQTRRERRFACETVNMGLLESVRKFLQTREWHRTKSAFVEIPPDDPRYEKAPYAESFIFHNETSRILPP